MRKSDFQTNPGIFGRSNYLVREMLALAEHALMNEGSAAALLSYWDANAALVRNAIVLAGTALPANTVAPALTGTAEVGSTLTVTSGTWTGSPTYAYEWQRDGVAISGATSTTYELTSEDLGAVITVVVTGTNAKGSVSAVSNASDPVEAGA